MRKCHVYFNLQAHRVCGECSTTTPIIPATVGTCVGCDFPQCRMIEVNVWGHKKEKKTKRNKTKNPYIKTWKFTYVHVNVKCARICHDRAQGTRVRSLRGNVRNLQNVCVLCTILKPLRIHFQLAALPLDGDGTQKHMHSYYCKWPSTRLHATKFLYASP